MLISKITALTMVMMLIFGMTLSVHADSLTTEQKAQVLYDLGLFNGMSTTEFIPDLEGYANREQAAKMVVVALGLNIVSSDVSSFTDVSEWAEPYVALAVSEGITNGISASEFGAEESITARQLATWFDRVITGSESAWEDNAVLDNDEGITRGDLVYSTYEALQKVPVGADKSLIESIVGEDEALLLIAIEGSLIDQVPLTVFDQNQTAYIVEVDVDDEKSITITMSNILNKETAEDTDNYKLYTGNGLMKDPIESIALTKVNEVTVFFEDTLSGSYIIVMDGIIDGQGRVVDDYENFLVGSSRGIFSIEVTDDDQIVVTFFVDVEEASAENERRYEVTDEDGDEMDIDRVRRSDDNEVSITFEESLNQGEVYTLKVTGLEAEEGSDINDSHDFVGNETVKRVEVTGNHEVVVTFSADVDKTSAENANNYLLKDQDGNGYSIEDVDLTDDDEVTITFDDYLDVGSYTLEVNDVEDKDGNGIDDEVYFDVD